jgi:hypothetical protein
MQRRTLDRLISGMGLALAALLVTAGALLAWGHNFVSTEVHNQLAAQKIFFPPAGSEATAGDEFAPMRQYAGQQLTTGDQAKVYANSFIAIHLSEVADGKTYAELSTLSRDDPTNEELAGQVATMFKGETLRGLLLNAYAFDTMGKIAGIASIVSFLGAAVILLLAGLGFWHSRKVEPVQTPVGKRTTPALHGAGV